MPVIAEDEIVSSTNHLSLVAACDPDVPDKWWLTFHFCKDLEFRAMTDNGKDRIFSKEEAMAYITAFEQRVQTSENEFLHQKVTKLLDILD